MRLNLPVVAVSVTDPLFGASWEHHIGHLPKGEQVTFTQDYTIPEGAPDPLVNTVTATGTDELGATVTDTDSHSVDILHPAISITKSGPSLAHVGDTITYTYIVKNTGDCPLTDVTIVDDKAGTVVTGESLAIGEEKTFTKDYTISATDPDPLVNTATATGTDSLGMTVSTMVGWSLSIPVVIITPVTYELTITKQADKSTFPGERLSPIL
ncbi:MAG: hypothetical protein QMD66_02485 [Actinomycetota bacterium]|nr:hypothetical protein [Actinomycetota bacterium]